jgi:hypothetical protein
MQPVSFIYFYITFLDDMFRESCSHHQVYLYTLYLTDSYLFNYALSTEEFTQRRMRWRNNHKC